MKRLIICADGTWNKPDQKDRDKRKPSNVVKILRAILPKTQSGTHQVVYYDAGVGTGWGIVDHLVGGAFGVGLSENVRESYRFLVNNYNEGDEVFFFGFSRGAFTVRSLAGLIGKIGLLTKADAYFIPDAYDHYRLITDETKDKNANENKEKIKKFRSGENDTYRHSATQDIKIKFIGVWDTVGSLGIPIGILNRWIQKKYQFHSVKLNDNIINAYHALAIDEKRKPFKPTLWEANDIPGQNLEQVWFPGVHTNIGGGYANDGLANCAFKWMLGKAELCGLEFDNDFTKYYKPYPNDELRKSMKWYYRLLGKYVRPIGRRKNGHESVDQCAKDRLEADPPPKPEYDGPYKPKNLLEYLKIHNAPN